MALRVTSISITHVPARLKLTQKYNPPVLTHRLNCQRVAFWRPFFCHNTCAHHDAQIKVIPPARGVDTFAWQRDRRLKHLTKERILKELAEAAEHRPTHRCIIFLCFTNLVSVIYNWLFLEDAVHSRLERAILLQQYPYEYYR